MRSIDAGSTARTEWIAAPIRWVSDGRNMSDALGPGVGTSVGEADLPVRRGRVAVGSEPTVEVQRVEEGDADAGLARRGEEGIAHLVGVRVGRSVGAVMEVVELTDARDAGQCHLGEGGTGESVVAVGLEPLRRPVHHVAPRPETAALGLGTRPQRPVERMAVGVRETGNRQPGQAMSVRRRRYIADDRAETSGVDLDRHTGGRSTVDDREFTPVAGGGRRRHDPTRSTKAVIRSTNASRWNASNDSQVVSVEVSVTRSTKSTPSR